MYALATDFFILVSTLNSCCTTNAKRRMKMPSVPMCHASERGACCAARNAIYLFLSFFRCSLCNKSQSVGRQFDRWSGLHALVVLSHGHLVLLPTLLKLCHPRCALVMAWLRTSIVHEKAISLSWIPLKSYHILRI